jgi:hypothetical protein
VTEIDIEAVVRGIGVKNVTKINAFDPKPNVETMKKAGLTVITLPPNEAKQYHDIAYNSTWEMVIKGAPTYGPRFRELMTRK